MQKLESENFNTPTNASLVCSNCGLQLNREKTSYPSNFIFDEICKLKLSIASKKTFSNNLEVNQAVSLKTDPLLVKSEILWSGCKPHTFNSGRFIHALKGKVFSPQGDKYLGVILCQR